MGTIIHFCDLCGPPKPSPWTPWEPMDPRLRTHGLSLNNGFRTRLRITTLFLLQRSLQAIFATQCQFHQHFTCVFLYKVLCKIFMYLHIRFELFLVQEYWRKCAHKMLVKLPPSVKKFQLLLQTFSLQKKVIKNIYKSNYPTFRH